MTYIAVERWSERARLHCSRRYGRKLVATLEKIRPPLASTVTPGNGFHLSDSCRIGRRSPIPLPEMSCLLELVESSTSSSSEFSPEADELLRWRTGLVLPWHLATNRSSAISSSRNGTWATRRVRVIEIWQKANV
uniref:Uncharacterized protein n=1 Tax=Anopheles merus TaxID=30066 RepID=A0A182V2V7_ANOME